MYVGQKIKNARKKAGLTQKELGDKLGVSYQMIAQYESDRRKPKIDTLRRICNALGITISELGSDVWKFYSPEDFAEDFSMVQTENGLIRILPKEQAQQKFDNELLNEVHKLDEEHQDKVLTYAKDLAKIPEYQKK